MFSAHFFVSVHGVRVDLWGLGAFGIAGAQSAWHAFRRWESEDWTTIQGDCTLAEVTKKGDHFRLRLLYSYKLPGEKYASSGEFEKDFDSEEEDTAAAWAERFRDQNIPVHANPSKADDSLLWDSELQSIADGLAGANDAGNAANSGELVAWEKTFLPATLVLAAAGFLFSLVIHIGAYVGFSLIPTIGFFGMQALAIALFFPAIKANNGNRAKKTSSDLMANWPEWLKILGHLFFYYAILNFVLLFFQSSSQDGVSFHLGDEVPMGVTRIFSAVWILLFVAEFGIIFTRLFCRGSGSQAGGPVLPPA